MLVFSATAFCQNTELFFPRNFEASYTKGIRSADGKPGPNYWQNRSDYKIQVELDPKEHEVEGFQETTYYNNSPDSLKMIRVKLQHDLYKKGGQRAADVDPKDLTDGVEINKLEINGVPVPKGKQRRHDSFLDIRLAAPLAPNASLKMTVAWEFTMPQDPGATRECVCAPGTYFIPYFYPEIAVYDDLHGWADAPYNGLQEFYHDFSNYDVRITLPSGYAAWATGEWQNAANMLQPQILERWNKAHTGSDIVSVFSAEEIKGGKVFQKAKKNVFHFVATDVPDFTFAVSNQYNWDATSVVVDDKTGRRAFISAVYDSGSNDFKKVARIAADGVRLMSTYLPGYPFPYPCLTIFNGNDGMEYPMMVNDASTSDEGVMGLTIHESAHTYFPFMMGINEQYYAWMDEGWANFFEHFTSDSLTNTKKQIWGASFGNDWDVPPMVPSKNINGSTYWFESYTRPQFAYTQLLDHLGYETFHKCMTAYMDRWKSKHPGPYEFFNTFNDVSGQNLNWFWKPWFFEFGYPDLGINTVARLDHASGSNQQVVYVDNKGNIPVPIHLTFYYTDGSKETRHETAGIWKDQGRKTAQFETTVGKTLKRVTLGGKTIPDVLPKDNSWSQ
jgi:Peptidase family M1 domain